MSAEESSLDTEVPGRVHRLVLWLTQPKIGLPLLLLMGLIVAPLGYRAAMISRVPVPPEPFDFKAFHAEAVPDDQNAAPRLIAAAELLSPNNFSRWERLHEFDDDPASEISASIREAIEENRSAIDAWREASRLLDSFEALVDRGDGFPFSKLSGSAAAMRRWLCRDARQLRAEGKVEEAADVLYDGVRAAYLMGRHSPMSQFDSSRQDREILYQEFLRLAAAPATQPDLLRRELRRYRDLTSLRPTAEYAIKYEHDTIVRHFRSLWGIQVGDILMIDQGGAPLNLALQVYLQGEPEIGIRGLGHTCGRILEQVRLPRHQRSPQTGSHLIRERTASSDPRSATASDMNHFLEASPLARGFSGLRHYEEAADENVAADDLFAVGVALVLHRRLHGAFPERLEELVPGILERLPDDAFSSRQEPLRYRRNNGEVTLWSLGPNAVDDGGQFTTDWANYYDDFGLRIPAVSLTQKKQ